MTRIKTLADVRTIEVGTEVAFEVAAAMAGRWEARAVTKRS